MGYTGDKKRQYQKDWINKRRQEWIDKHGPCAKCGSTQKLEVDHIDPKTKELTPGGLWSLAKDNPKRIEELSKCQVLCHDCHKEKTRGEHPKGEANNSKITESDALAIKNSEEPTRILAKRYKLNRRTVQRIRSGDKWKHLP